jgi:hypothetical protein
MAVHSFHLDVFHLVPCGVNLGPDRYVTPPTKSRGLLNFGYPKLLPICWHLHAIVSDSVAAMGIATVDATAGYAIQSDEQPMICRWVKDWTSETHVRFYRGYAGTRPLGIQLPKARHDLIGKIHLSDLEL